MFPRESSFPMLLPLPHLPHKAPVTGCLPRYSRPWETGGVAEEHGLRRKGVVWQVVVHATSVALLPLQ